MSESNPALLSSTQTGEGVCLSTAKTPSAAAAARERYNPYEVSPQFVASMTVAGLLGAGTNAAALEASRSRRGTMLANGSHSGGDSVGDPIVSSFGGATATADPSNRSSSSFDVNASKRIATETRHEERLRHMMQKMCRDLRESHFPGSSANAASAAGATSSSSAASAGRRANTSTSHSFGVAGFNASSAVPAAAVNTSSTPLNGDEDDANMSKYAKEWAAERRAREAAEAEDEERRIAAAAGGPLKPLVYPNYDEISTRWTSAALDDPRYYTELIVRQNKTARELLEARDNALHDANGGDPTVAVMMSATLRNAADIRIEKETVTFLDGASDNGVVGTGDGPSSSASAVGADGVAAAPSASPLPPNRRRASVASSALLGIQSEDQVAIANRRRSGAKGLVDTSAAEGGSSNTCIANANVSSQMKRRTAESVRLTTDASGGMIRHAVEDDAELFTLEDHVVPAMAVSTRHLPTRQAGLHRELTRCGGGGEGESSSSAVPLSILPPVLPRSQQQQLVDQSVAMNTSSSSPLSGVDLSSSTAQHHTYTAPLLVARQKLPTISPFTTILGKHTVGRRFHPVCAEDQRDHRLQQLTAKEIADFERGYRKLPDGPIVSDWRCPSETSLAVVDAKRRAMLMGMGMGGGNDNDDSGGSGAQMGQMASLCDMLKGELRRLEEEDRFETERVRREALLKKNTAEEMDGLRGDIDELTAAIGEERQGVEVAAMEVDVLDARFWEKEQLGDVYVDLDSKGVESCLPLTSPLKASRMMILTSPDATTRAEARRREREMIEGALAVSPLRLRSRGGAVDGDAPRLTE